MKYTISWLSIILLILLFAPNPYQSVLVLISLHLFLWTVLCGGLNAMYEIVEAKIHPKLPMQPPILKRNPSLVVIGSAMGLGKEVVAMAKRKKYSVQEGDVLFQDNKRHVDLTSIQSIKNFCDQCPFKTIDVLVCVAGVCDATGVPVKDSIHPRMLWVNYLGHVVVIEEFKRIGILINKIVVVSSGSYARGSSKLFYPKTWGVTEAIQNYSQSKFLLTTYFARLQSFGQRIILINPGPMNSTIGDRHVPLLLWPIFGLMKEILFPVPLHAAKAVIYCVDTKKNIDYFHIRKEGLLSATVRDPTIQRWVLKETQKALGDLYDLSK